LQKKIKNSKLEQMGQIKRKIMSVNSFKISE